MRITDRGAVYRNESDPARSSCFSPSICVLPQGRWLSAFSVAPTKMKPARECLISHSDNRGGSWSPPIAPFSAPPVEGKPGGFRSAYLTPLGGQRVLASLIWVDQTDPALPFFNETTEGLLDTRIFLAFSDDSGVTWSKPRLIESSPFNMPVPLTGATLVLPSGEWACQFELNKPYEDTSPWRHSSVLMFSDDAGNSWHDHVRVTDDPELRLFYWDQRPVVLSDRRILNLFWTFDRKSAVYLNAHARESRDNGRTWSQIWDCGFPGQPAPPVSLPDGRIAVVYMDRTAAPVLKLRVSNDGGRTWPKETEVVLHEPQLNSQNSRKKTMQDAWAEMSKFSIGLPCTALTREGDLLVVYYAGTHTDRTGVEWITIHPA